MTKIRKHIFGVDFERIEKGYHLSPTDAVIRERLATTRDFDALIFWLDMEEAMKQLTPRQRECFTLKYLEGYTTAEIMKKLGITQQALSKQLIPAKEKIKYFLRDGCETA